MQNSSDFHRSIIRFFWDIAEGSDQSVIFSQSKKKGSLTTIQSRPLLTDGYRIPRIISISTARNVIRHKTFAYRGDPFLAATAYARPIVVAELRAALLVRTNNPA